ncbi:class I SAM-dependent methyltransferase, partial [bacterium]|nr:class I SAM-dependent methyltransferase [bacterium]
QDKAHSSAKSHIKGSISKQLNAKHSVKIINKYISSGALLEIGSGGGLFLLEANKNGYVVYGIELNPIQAEYIRNELGFECVHYPLSEGLFDNIKFDIIYHCDVLSHFYNPVSEFKKMHDKLNDDGLLIFETGNLGDVSEKYFKRYTHFQYPDHLFFFSEKSIEKLLLQTGFGVIKFYRYSIVPQLYIARIIRYLTMQKKPLSNEINPNDKPVEKKSASTFFKKVANVFYHYFIYLIRYKLGSIILKKRRPKTIIVVAKKIT